MSSLFIIRHAYAGQHGDPRYPDDALRPLTAEGSKQFRKAMKKLAERGLEIDVIATSPLVRCRQTAEIVRDRLDAKPELVELDALEPGSDLSELVEWSNAQPYERIAWVGHAPDVDRLTCALLGAPAHAIAFRKGAIACLNFEAEIASGTGELRYFLAPADLGCRRSD